jgi:hypothetical protein
MNADKPIAPPDVSPQSHKGHEETQIVRPPDAKRPSLFFVSFVLFVTLW